MKRQLYVRIIGIAGILFFLYGYYLLSLSPDIEFTEAVRRGKIGMTLSIIGAFLVGVYIFKR